AIPPLRPSIRHRRFSPVALLRLTRSATSSRRTGFESSKASRQMTYACSKRVTQRADGSVHDVRPVPATFVHSRLEFRVNKRKPDRARVQRRARKPNDTQYTHAAVRPLNFDQCVSGKRKGCGGAQPAVLAAVERGGVSEH